MAKRKFHLSLTHVWKSNLHHLMHLGERAAPRGMETREILQKTFTIDMRQPVLTIPSRKLSYRFMAAEAYWILTGDDRVETIEPFNKNIAQFSDNGVTFYGAYGPKIRGQLTYVVEKLLKDRDSRQAGLTIWRENPPDTKDVPCTIAIFFSVRDGLLNAHVYMRSSDIWLGLPYDAFNFSMLAHLVCAHYNEGMNFETMISPGSLYLTAASSHIYQRNWEDARYLLLLNDEEAQLDTPTWMYTNPDRCLQHLDALRYARPGDSLRWWEVKNEQTVKN